MLLQLIQETWSKYWVSSLLKRKCTGSSKFYVWLTRLVSLTLHNHFFAVLHSLSVFTCLSPLFTLKGKHRQNTLWNKWQQDLSQSISSRMKMKAKISKWHLIKHKRLHSKGNNKQNEESTLRMGENICRTKQLTWG